MGCGNLSPEHITGLHVVDLGSGNGRDSFALSKLVGEHGSVIGVDIAHKQVHQLGYEKCIQSCDISVQIRNIFYVEYNYEFNLQFVLTFSFTITFSLVLIIVITAKHIGDIVIH